MKPYAYALGFLALIAAVPAASAASRLKAIMHDWKAEVADAEGLIAGGYDAAAMTGVLNAFLAGSNELEARAGGGAQGEDIKARFVKFSADAQSALDAVGSKDRVGARLKALRSDCRSCHDVYAN